MDFDVILGASYKNISKESSEPRSFTQFRQVDDLQVNH